MQFASAAVAAGVSDHRGAGRDAVRRARAPRPVPAGQRIAEWPDGTVATRVHLHPPPAPAGPLRAGAGGRQVRLHREIGARLEVRLRGGDAPARHGAGGALRPWPRCRGGLCSTCGWRPSRRCSAAPTARRSNSSPPPGDPPNRPQPASVPSRSCSCRPLCLGADRDTRWAARETEAAFVRAYELCQQLDDTPLRFQVLFGLAALHEWRGEYQQAQVLMEQRLRAPGGQQAAPSCSSRTPCWPAPCSTRACSRRRWIRPSTAWRCTRPTRRTRSWPPSARSPKSSTTAGPPWRSGSWDTPTGRWSAPTRGCGARRTISTAWPARRRRPPGFTSAAWSTS